MCVLAPACFANYDYYESRELVRFGTSNETIRAGFLERFSMGTSIEEIMARLPGDYVIFDWRHDKNDGVTLPRELREERAIDSALGDQSLTIVLNKGYHPKGLGHPMGVELQLRLGFDAEGKLVAVQSYQFAMGP